MRRILSVIALLGVLALIYVVVTIDNRIKEHIEKTASILAGVPVTIESVNVSFFQGAGKITGLKVGNPDGYVNEYAFTMDSMEFDMETSSMFSQPLIINRLFVDAPDVNLEVTEDLNTNLQDIVEVSNRQNNVDGKKKKGSKNSSDKEQDESAQDDSQVVQDEGDTSSTGVSTAGERTEKEDYLMIVKSFEISNIQLHAQHKDETWEDSIPEIVITDLGAPEGVNTRVVGITVVRALAKETLERAAARSAAEIVKEKIDELGSKLLESLLKD